MNGYSNTPYYEITIELKKNVPKKVSTIVKPKTPRRYVSNDSPEPYYNGESIETIERREGHGFWGNSHSGYLTDDYVMNMP
jgi:hypothetical protein